MDIMKELSSRTPLARDIMTKCKVVLTEDSSIKNFIRIIAEKRIDFAPVIDITGSVVGVVTEKDLTKLVKIQPVPSMQAVIAKEVPKMMLDQPVSKIMTRKPIIIKESADIKEAMNFLVNQNFKFVIVVDDDKKPVGVIRTADIFRKFME